MRLFFAVTLPDDLVQAVERVQRGLAAAAPDPGVRWTRPHQFHFTVRFLGDQPAERAGRAVEAAAEVCSAQRPFTVTLGGVGAFPNARRPTVLWVGAGQGAEELQTLATCLEAALAARGFARENRGLTPHITLARVKTWAGEAAAARALRSAQVEELGSARVDRLTLMQSVLRPTGSEYTVVRELPFLPAA